MDDVLIGLGQALVDGSLSDEELLGRTDGPAPVEILPDANVVKIGGRA